MHRSIAPLSVLLLSCALPFAASAATPTRDLCRLAQNDPADFMQRPNFADEVLRMSKSCPKTVLALTNLSTGSIATAIDDGGNDKTTSGKQGRDFSDLLSRLKVATKNLDTATTNVEKAQANLNRTVRKAKDCGLSEEELQALYAMHGEDGNRRALPQYTADKRAALANYVAARDRLSAAEEKLDQANDRAKDLVQNALELAGKANVAQEDLSKVLDGLTREERQAMMEKSIADAKQAVIEIAARVAEDEKAFERIYDELKEAWASRDYKKVARELEEEKKDYAKAEKSYQDRLARDPSCKGHECKSALKKVNEAAKDLEKAQAEFYEVEEGLNIPTLSVDFNVAEAALAASRAAQEIIDEQAADAERQAKKLADLLSAAEDALAQAEAASAEARAATAPEEAEVAAARAALEVALAAANAALEGSAEEQAALEDVYAAQEALRAALDDLGAAQSVVADLTTEVADIENAPETVTDTAEELETASEESDAVEEDALEDLATADEAVADYNDAQSDLSEAVEADAPEASQDSTAEAPEASQDSTADVPSEPNT